MDTIYPAAVNAIARLLILLGLLAYGWFCGGWAGLLAMGFVVCFLTFGAAAVVAEGWICSLWAAVKWFVYFIVFHFILFSIDEELSDDVLVFLGATLDGVVALIKSVDPETRLGILLGMSLVGGVGWFLLRK